MAVVWVGWSCDTVTKVGYLVSSASFPVLNNANNLNTVTNLQDFQTCAWKVETVVNNHTVVHACFFVVVFYIDTLVTVESYNALEGYARVVVNVDVCAKFAQRYCCDALAGNFGVSNTTVNCDFVTLCLAKCAESIFAVTIVTSVTCNCQTVLQNFHVEVAPCGCCSLFVPNPNKCSVTGGVNVPSGCVRLDHDFVSICKFFLGETRCCFAVVFDTTGGLGCVYCKISCFQHATWSDISRQTRYVEVRCVAIDVGLEFNFGASPAGRWVKLNFVNVVNKFEVSIVFANGANCVYKLVVCKFKVEACKFGLLLVEVLTAHATCVVSNSARLGTSGCHHGDEFPVVVIHSWCRNCFDDCQVCVQVHATISTLVVSNGALGNASSISCWDKCSDVFVFALLVARCQTKGQNQNQ